MSQEKVERYKKEKANRKKTMKKQKIYSRVRSVFMGAVMLTLVAWIGCSAYTLYQENQPREVAEIDYTAIDAYVQSLGTGSGE